MIYRGYSIFRKMEGIIIEVPNRDPYYHGDLARIGERNFILLALQNSLDDQIKTVIHELLHIGYEYGTPQWKIIPGLPIPRELGISKEQAIEYIKNIEELIERETEKVLQTQPVLVDHLKNLILNSTMSHPKL